MLHGVGSLNKWRAILEKVSVSTVFPDVITHDDYRMNLKLPKEMDLSFLSEGMVRPYFLSAYRQRNQCLGPLMLVLAEMLNHPLEPIIPAAVGMELLLAGLVDLDDINDNGVKRRNVSAGHLIEGNQIFTNTAELMMLELLRIIVNSNFSDSSKLYLTKEFVASLMEFRLSQGIEFQADRTKTILPVDQFMFMYKSRNHCVSALSAAIVLSQCNISSGLFKAIYDQQYQMAFSIQVANDINNIENPIYYSAKDTGIQGGDIMDGKRTVVISMAMKNLPEKAKRIKEIIDMEHRDQSHVNEVLDYIVQGKALQSCKKMADDLLMKHWEKTDKMIPDSEAKEELRAASFDLQRFLL